MIEATHGQLSRAALLAPLPARAHPLTHFITAAASPATLPSFPQEPGQFVDQAAFHTSYVAEGAVGPASRRYGSIYWDDAVMNIINDETIVRLALQPRYLPMLVPARPWTRFNDGGHLVLESLMMRGGYSRLGPSVAQIKELERMQKEMDEAR